MGLDPGMVGTARQTSLLALDRFFVITVQNDTLSCAQCRFFKLQILSIPCQLTSRRAIEWWQQ